MADLNGFDANKVEPTDFAPIPSGKYLAMVTASEMKPTKNGDGRYLNVTFQILEGEYRNRVVWGRFNLENRNETAVKIARGQLSALCRAVGVLTPKDSCELHNLPLVIKVKLKKQKDSDDLQNEVSGFAKKDTFAPAQSAPVQSTPPWRR